MELQTIVDRYAEGLAVVDQTTTIVNVNQRTKEEYLPGLKTLNEDQAVEGVAAWWANTYPLEVATPPNSQSLRVPYPGLAKAVCDHILTTDGDSSSPEWAIEVKYPELVGNNGNRNDFVVAKMLSPYMKDRGLLHDSVRLRDQDVGRRKAVLGFTFGYDAETCTKAKTLHPGNAAYVANIATVVKANLGELHIRPLVTLADAILRVRGLVDAARCEATFEAWRHPCGGEGLVFAWELLPTPTAHHPW